MNNRRDLLIIYLPVILISFINSVKAQQDLCLCLCCIGAGCSPFAVGSLYIPSCTIGTCLQQCRTAFSQCQGSPPNGQASPQCLSSISPTYNCQCDCCNTGFSNCVPTFVGHSSAYVCQTSSCSISCATQYPNQCVSNHNGQTIGTCTGLIPTTTTTSLTTNFGGTSYICSCWCCASGFNCSPNINVGSAIAYACSSLACTQACQNQYPGRCPAVPSFGQTNGVCTNQISGNRRCKCSCYGTTGYINYETTTSGSCTSCYESCRLQSPCGSTASITYDCNSSISKTSYELSCFIISFLLILALL